MRADVTHGSTILANRSTPAERAASKADTHWTDTFERFHPNCREILETPSKWGIDRNVGFDADVVVPSVDRDVQVDGRGFTQLNYVEHGKPEALAHIETVTVRQQQV